jgi:NADH-quinone oxidoreductase subunit M
MTLEVAGLLMSRFRWHKLLVFTLLKPLNSFSFMFTRDFLLPFLLFSPLLALGVLLVGTYSGASPAARYTRSLWIAAFRLLLTLQIAFVHTTTAAGFQGTSRVVCTSLLVFGLRRGVDSLSLVFLLLTQLFQYLCFLSLSPATPRLAHALAALFFLQFGVLGSFLFLDLLAFFVFFERTLIPIYFLVLVWGSRERRVRASYRIALYTLFGSLFRFFNLLYLYAKTGTTDYELLLPLSLTIEEQRFL